MSNAREKFRAKQIQSVVKFTATSRRAFQQKAGVRAPNRDQSSLAATEMQRGPALRKSTGRPRCAWGREKQVSPVVKRRVTSRQTTQQVCVTCRGASLQGRGRSPEAQGTGRTQPRLFSLFPGESHNKVRPVVKTRVTSPVEREMQVQNERPGDWASEVLRCAQDFGARLRRRACASSSNPVTGICARVAKR